jgi:ATP-dependent Clp protease ATP-binding subunit ClpC
MEQRAKLIWWQRLTERAQRAFVFADEEAGQLGESYVAPEHLLLGLLREDDTAAADVLDRTTVGRSRIRSEIGRYTYTFIADDGSQPRPDKYLTPRTKHILDLALDEARQLNQPVIGTGHLLLGLIREGEGLAGRVLKELGVDLEKTRSEVESIQDREAAPGQSPDNQESKG